MSRHVFCGHETIKDAALCRTCNPKRLSEDEFRECLGAMVDPRRVPPRFARILIELADLAAAAEAAQKGEQQ
jgi:hypothetical protein